LCVGLITLQRAPAVDASLTHGPNLRFIRELPGDSTQRDIAANVLPIADGAIVTGWTSRAGAPAQGLVLRLDDSANVVWRRELGGESADLLFAAQPDGDGLLCAGFTASKGAGSTDGWFVRIDAAGATTTEWTVGGEGEERLTSLVPTPNGWIAAGQKTRDGDTDAWVVELDRAGKERAQWTWGGAGIQRGLGIAALPDGGCAITGRMGAEDSRETVDGFVTRFTADGHPSWTRPVRGPGFQVAYHLRSSDDGSLLVTGYGWLDPARDHDAFVLRLDGKGRLIFRRNLGGTGYDRATQSVELDDGGTVTVGYAKRDGAANDAPAWQTTLQRLNRHGQVVWSVPIGEKGYESGRWIARDATGDLWVVSQQTPPQGGSRVLVTRIDVPGLRKARSLR
jgi:hypothetical protein